MPDSTNQPASPIELRIDARVRPIESYTVRRVLPWMQRRRVGPFTFLDHMGPLRAPPGQGMDVRPHPHIGLSTVTYLFDGEIVHRDSLGTERVIRPGDVNWMLAGRGIVHSERTPVALRESGASMHGLQFWVALPTEVEEAEPSFAHTPAEQIPIVEARGIRLKVVAGSGFGESSPIRGHSPTLLIDAMLEPGTELAVPQDTDERAVYVVEGSIDCAGETCPAGRMLVFRRGANVTVRAGAQAHVVLLGGAAIPGERYMWWNFVSSSKERIEQAKQDWKAGRFPKVPGDQIEFVPLPE